jgi:hypothetical protein
MLFQPSMLRMFQKSQVADGLPQKISVDVALHSHKSGSSPAQTSGYIEPFF